MNISHKSFCIRAWLQPCRKAALYKMGFSPEGWGQSPDFGNATFSKT
jgi:hypothetical protein